MQKQLKPGKSTRSLKRKLSKQGTLGNDSFQLLKQFQSNKSQLKKSNRNSSLSNKQEPTPLARNTHETGPSGILSNMNIYTKYKSNRANNYDELTNLKKDLSKEVNQIRKGYKTFMDRKNEEKDVLLQYSSVMDDRMKVRKKEEEKTDYNLQSLYQRRTIDFDVKNSGKDHWRFNNRKKSLYNAEKQFQKGRKKSLANLTINTGSRQKEDPEPEPNKSDRQKDRKKQKQPNIKNLLYSNFVKNNVIINNKEVINKKKIKNEISVNLNLNFNIDGIPKEKETKKEAKKDKGGKLKKKDSKKMNKPSDSRKNLIDIMSADFSEEEPNLMEPEKVTELTYYKKSLLSTLNNKLVLGKKKDTYLNELFFDHFKSTYLDFAILNKTDVKRMLKKARPFADPFQSTNSKGYLFLDLDETLVHCSFKKGNNEAIPFKISNSNQTVS